MIVFILTGGIILVLILGYFIIEYSFLIPTACGIPVLMYHKVSSGKISRDTVSTEILEMQFAHIVKKGYHAISFLDIKNNLETATPLPSKPVIITFDDAYENFYESAVPILKKYGLKTTLFIPVAYMAKTNAWDQGNDPILTPDQLKVLGRDGQIEFGLHSFLHRSYAEYDIAGMREDLNNCYNTLNFYSIPYTRVLAYPYGAYPRKDKELNAQMKALFREMKLTFAVRVGNRINRYPFKDPYEITRTEIRGTDSLFAFRIKLKKGRKKLFS
jgi:peptidoglycan/xylan/chitin deacetylase (PgdA/CDA1 family)